MKNWRVFILVLGVSVVSTYIALFPGFNLNFSLGPISVDQYIVIPEINFYLWGRQINPKFYLKRGLDIQGGMQVILDADMSSIDDGDREVALASASEIISRRVDMYGINEPKVRTAKQGNSYRIVIELPGVTDQQQALQLVGQTAELEFRLAKDEKNPEATAAAILLENFKPTGLTGQDLKKSGLQFNQQTGEPVVSLVFNQEGQKKFAEITKNNQGKVLAIYIDGFPVTMPVINEPILNGQAMISGSFSVEQAENLAIQLNAGALPVPIKVIEQSTVGASLGNQSVQQSIQAGLIGLGLVMAFMILYYGAQGIIASIVLMIYAVITMAVYKLIGVTLTLSGIAGLLLSIGMAVDSNILIFERIKDELRIGIPFSRAMEQGFGKAWDSIKDANLATIITALVLINPMDFSFLNTSGLVRGFGLTMLIGVIISLFTGIVVSRNLLRIFLPIFNNVYALKTKKRKNV